MNERSPRRADRAADESAKMRARSPTSTTPQAETQTQDTAVPLLPAIEVDPRASGLEPLTVDRLHALQRTHGNQFVQGLLRRTEGAQPAGPEAVGDRAHAQPLAPLLHVDAPTLQRDQDEQMSFSERYWEAVETQPPNMAAYIGDIAGRVARELSEIDDTALFFNELQSVWWDCIVFRQELREMPGGSETTSGQREKGISLVERWSSVETRMEQRNEQEARAALMEARAGTERLREQMLFAYRDIFMAGEEPEDVEVSGGYTVQNLAEQVIDVLTAINDSDAAISGRSVAPLLPVLGKVFSVVKLFLGWKAAPAASEVEKDMEELRNAIDLATTGLGLAGMGKFLPMFSHIGPMLDNIAGSVSEIADAARRENRVWWALREEGYAKYMNHEVELGGDPVRSYMIRIFSGSEPPGTEPSDDVVDFFDEHRDMFTRTMKEVMGKPGLRTRSSWWLFTEVDPKRLNSWVFSNRDSVWKLIYGREMPVP